MKKVLSIICFLILGVMLIFNLISIVSMKILKKDYVNFFGYTYFEVQTGSMISTININDIIIVKTNQEYKEGDIVTYKSKGSFITHRIVEIDGEKIITKGDANDSNDEPIKENQIVGKVVKIIGGFTGVTKVLQNPITLLLIFALGVLIITYSSFKKEKE